jgi:uncharacterized membrane protein YedE/YeeE
MGGAIAIYALTYWVIRPRVTILRGSHSILPSKRAIDVPLVAGASLFGLGWGIAGLCPGPALTSLASGQTYVLLFVGAMLVGMYLFKIVSGVQERLARADFSEVGNDRATVSYINFSKALTGGES